MKKQQPHCAKETFWNKLRVQNNYRIKDLAKELGVATGTLGSWLCGKVIPEERNLWNICDKFGVDYNTGYNEFVKASNIWDSERGRLKYNMYSPIIPEDIEPTRRKYSHRKSNSLTKQMDNLVRLNKILKYFYGKLSYEEYRVLREELNDPNEIIVYLYGRVSLEDFNYAFGIFGNK